MENKELKKKILDDIKKETLLQSLTMPKANYT